MGQVHWERIGNDASSHIGPETHRFYVVFVPYDSYNFWLWCFRVKVNPEWIFLPIVCSVYEEGKKLRGGGQLLEGHCSAWGLASVLHPSTTTTLPSPFAPGAANPRCIFWPVKEPTPSSSSPCTTQHLSGEEPETSQRKVHNVKSRTGQNKAIPKPQPVLGFWWGIS